MAEFGKTVASLAARGISTSLVWGTMTSVALLLFGCGKDQTGYREGLTVGADEPQDGTGPSPGGSTVDPEEDSVVCAAGEYISAEATETSDRMCTPCVDGYSTEENAEACIPFTTCRPGQFIENDGTRTEDRVCSPCADGTYSALDNAESCQDWSICEAGQFVVSAPTIESDRVCGGCSAGSFSTEENAASCQPWINCDSGLFVANTPDATTDRICEACGDGEFTPVANLSRCLTAEDCGAGSVLSASSCDPCEAGEFCPGGEEPAVPCADGFWDHDEDPATACIVWTDCISGESVSNAGTRTRDRACVACDIGFYSTGVNEEGCLPQKDCDPGTYVSRGGSQTEDRACTACEAGEFTSLPNQGSCQTWSDCGAGTFVTNVPDLNDDRQCSACPSGAFNLGLNAETCQDWRDCPAGEYVSNTPSATLDRVCSECADGTFSSVANQNSCLPHGACEAGTVQTAPGTDTTPPACEACEVGEYCAGDLAPAVPCAAGTWDHDADPATMCVAHTSCVPGQYVVSEGGATVDRACSVCPTGYTTTANASACVPWTDCSPGEEVDSQGTTVSDRTCAVCEGGFSTALNQNTCVPWTECDAGYIEDIAPTTTSDRTCIVDWRAGCVVIEDFETWPNSMIWSSNTGTLREEAAYEGSFGIVDPDWTYRTDITVQAGDVIRIWFQPGGGRIYLGFDADASGTKSVVAAMNTQDIRLQDNPGYSFTELSTVTQTFVDDTWYFLEANLNAGGNVSVNLFDEAGTLLNTVAYNYGSYNGGGIAIRAFAGAYLDSLSHCRR